MSLVVKSRESVSGFSTITADELLFINGGSGCKESESTTSDGGEKSFLQKCKEIFVYNALINSYGALTPENEKAAQKISGINTNKSSSSGASSKSSNKKN